MYSTPSLEDTPYSEQLKQPGEGGKIILKSIKTNLTTGFHDNKIGMAKIVYSEMVSATPDS